MIRNCVVGRFLLFHAFVRVPVRAIGMVRDGEIAALCVPEYGSSIVFFVIVVRRLRHLCSCCDAAGSEMRIIE